jgi:carbon storage regulator
MLVLSRRPGEAIIIETQIKIVVLEVQGNRVRLGISAPENVRVARQEVRERISKPTSVPDRGPESPGARRVREQPHADDDGTRE